MGPMQVESVIGKIYDFACIDDFSRYTWADFIIEKSDMFDVFKTLCVRLKTKKDRNIGEIRSNHGKEFENINFA